MKTTLNKTCLSAALCGAFVLALPAMAAGAGGTAVDGGTSTALALGLGLLAFGLTAGGITMRRRVGQH